MRIAAVLTERGRPTRGSSAAEDGVPEFDAAGGYAGGHRRRALGRACSDLPAARQLLRFQFVRLARSPLRGVEQRARRRARRAHPQRRRLQPRRRALYDRRARPTRRKKIPITGPRASPPGTARISTAARPPMAKSSTCNPCRLRTRPCRCRPMRGSPIFPTTSRSSSASMIAGPIAATASSTSRKRAANLLGFYGSGLAPVRVEYVGRAPLEGSDDNMLMATLRQGEPAPTPSLVRVASAKPFVPAAVSRAALRDVPTPPDRPYGLGDGQMVSNFRPGASRSRTSGTAVARAREADPPMRASPALSAYAPARPDFQRGGDVPYAQRHARSLLSLHMPRRFRLPRAWPRGCGLSRFSCHPQRDCFAATGLLLEVGGHG